MGLIIVEGIGGTGKTTLVEHIAKENQVAMMPEMNSRNEWPRVLELLEQAFYDKGLTVYDRLYFSHIVNDSHPFDQKSPMIAAGAEALRDLMDEDKALLIHCHPPLDAIKKYDLTGDSEEQKEARRAYLAFEDLFRGLPHVEYDFSSLSSRRATYEAAARFIAKWLS